MVAPDYQEFANRPGSGYPWQYRDLRFSYGQNLSKSARRCANTTPPSQHESGTFRLRRQKSPVLRCKSTVESDC